MMFDHLSAEQLYAYLDDELEHSDKELYAQHLQQCEQCQAELQGIEELYAVIGLVPETRLERDLAGSVVAELERSNRSPARLPLWLAAQGLVAAGIVAAWMTLQPGRPVLVGGLLDQIDLVFWWSQWALPRVSDLRLALAVLPEQVEAWLTAMDLGGLWAPPTGLPWAPIIVGLLVLWLVSNSVLLRFGRRHG